MAGSESIEAETSELPPVLAAPPWLERRPPAVLPVIEKLERLPFEDKIALSPAEHAHFARPSISIDDLRGWNMIPRHLEPRTPAMEAFVRERLAARTRYGTAWLFLMSDEAAWAFLEANGVANLVVDTSDIRHLYVRFGARMLAVLERQRAEVDLSNVFVTESPGVAAALALGMARGPKAAREKAAEYFAKFPEASAIGILPLVLAKKTQKSTLKALLALAADDRADALRAVAARYGPEVVAAVDALLAYEAPPPNPPALPAWYDPDALPPIDMPSRGKRLPRAARVHLGTLLAICTLEEAHERLDEVRQACSPESLARFAWALFETWLANGADAKHDWALAALGHLGNDDAARALAPLVRAWPGEAAHARAVKGLDVLARIGTDVALMHLDAIAEKVKFKGLQDRARVKIAEVAAERGLSRDQLADRVAPTLGLDPDGSRVLSFGPRSFRVGFDEQLTPFVTDDGGARLAGLPKPRATDDAAIADASVALWKSLKKDARAVAANQIHRLERAMCTQRRWTAMEFRTLLLGHPLVVHLVRRLLWATYQGGVAIHPFRVAEDRSLAGADDAPFELPSGASVGIAHRLELSDDQATQWGALFADYEILQPFSQLARDVYPMRSEEREATSLTRMAGAEVPTHHVIGLETRGWRRSVTGDGGVVGEMTKPLGHELWAELPLEDGYYVASIADSPKTQRLGAVVVHRGSSSLTGVRLGEIPPVEFSELVRDLETLRT